MSHSGGSTRAIYFALGGNLGIAFAKTGAAIYTGSGAMLAEAIHSFADTGNQILLLVGLNWSKRSPTLDHPLGFGKAIYFWSFIVALMLFSMGGMFSIYEGMYKIMHPSMPESPWLAIGVLTFSIILESISLRGAIVELNKSRGNKSLWRWFVTSRQSELLVVTGEDIAAIGGLSLANIAVILTMVTGNPLFDALGTVAIGTLLIVVALLVGTEIKSLLIGESADSEVVVAIRDFLTKRDEIVEIFNLITIQLGIEVMVAVKARMSETSSATQLIDNINRVEQDLKAAFPSVRWIFFEPDHTD